MIALAVPSGLVSQSVNSTPFAGLWFAVAPSVLERQFGPPGPEQGYPNVSPKAKKMRPSASVMIPKSVPQISSCFIRLGTFELGPVIGQTIPTLTSLIIGVSGCAYANPPINALKNATEYFRKTGVRVKHIAYVRQRSTVRIYRKCKSWRVGGREDWSDGVME